MIDLDRMRRWCANGSTWSGKAARLLAASGREATTDSERFLVAYDAEQFLFRLLMDVGLVVDVLDPENMDNVERLARELARDLRAHRLAALLSNVEGRTPAEAASFLEAADALSPSTLERSQRR